MQARNATNSHNISLLTKYLPHDGDLTGQVRQPPRVERVFRSLKSVDLKVRPIRHYREKRVRAHVFLCMLAYYVEWHMRRALAPMLFDDERKDEAKALSDSVVAPARRSAHAQQKAQNGRSEDGAPIHSFQTLLEDLATLCRNTVRVKTTEATFTDFTTPTPVQEKAFTLLHISPEL